MFRNLFIRFFAAIMLVSFLFFILSCDDEDHVIVLDTLHLDQKEFVASSEGGNYDVNANETIQLTSSNKNFQLSNTERFSTLEHDKLETGIVLSSIRAIRNSCTSPFSQTRQTQHVKTI